MNNDHDEPSDVSSLDTHFQERDGDEDNLWEVEAIVAERGAQYRVRWAGVDDCGAPWPLDWVPKKDCTDPLVRKWKREKARKRKRDERNSSLPRKRQKLVASSSKVIGNDNDDDDSAIDQFDSPHRPALTTCSPSADHELPPAATDVITKGIALAEAAQRASKQNTNSTPTFKLPLATILEKKRKRSSSLESRSSPVIALEAFADSFVDYEGGVSVSPKSITLDTTQHQPIASPLWRPQEEEEDTQDLMAEVELPPQVLVFSDEEPVISPEIAPTPVVEKKESVQLHPPKRSPSPSDMLVVPATMSPSRLHEELIVPSQTVSDRSGHLDSAMHLLNKKSEEIIRLEHLITTLTSDKHTLQISLEAHRHRTAFAEKNADVFREEYLRVSALVDDLRRENAMLEERASVAEVQVREGVEGVRTMYERRIAQLEEEVVYQKSVATFCVEQSQRTQDEQVRRRAAECEEVEGRCNVLEERMEGARGMIERLEKLATMKDRENEALRVDRKKKEEEMEMLRVDGRVKEEEIEKLKKLVVEEERNQSREIVEWKKMEESSVVLEKEIEEEIESLEMLIVEEPSRGETTGEREPVTRKEHEEEEEEEEEEERSLSTEVYVCMWRREGREKCHAMFLSIEALKQHLELSGHLQ